MLKRFFFTVMWTVLLGWSCSIINQIVNDDKLSFIDRVPIRAPKWADTYDVAAVKIALNTTWTITSGCNDMSKLWYPSITYADASNTPGCAIDFGRVSRGALNNEVILTNRPTAANGCKPGTYPLRLSGGALDSNNDNLGATVTGLVTLQVKAVNGPNNLEFTFVSGNTVGNAVKLNWSQIDACNAQRRNMVNALESAVHCQEDTSPFCTCVRSGTRTMYNSNHTVVSITADNVVRSLDNCMHATRYVYDRDRNIFDEPIQANNNKFSRAVMLFSFLLAMFLNSARETLEKNVLARWLSNYGNWAQFLIDAVITTVVFVLPLTLSTIFVSHGNGSIGLMWGVAVAVPAFLITLYWHAIMPVYSVQKSTFVEGMAVENNEHSLLPHIHPFFFDTGLCSLMLFTLTTRGVVDKDALIIGIIKCHAVTAIYVALAWYNVHRRKRNKDDNCFEDIFVQESYLGGSLLALAATCDNIIIPYATKEGVQLHWFLPALFAVSAFAPMAWMGTLHKWGLQAGRDLPLTLPFLVGVLVLAVMVASHTVLFGNEPGHYPHSDFASIEANRKLMKSYSI